MSEPNQPTHEVRAEITLTLDGQPQPAPRRDEEDEE